MLHRLLDTDVKRDALELAKAGLWDDAGPEQAIAQGGAGGGTLANSQVSKILTGLEIIIQFVCKRIIFAICNCRMMSIGGQAWRIQRS